MFCLYNGGSRVVLFQFAGVHPRICVNVLRFELITWFFSVFSDGENPEFCRSNYLNYPTLKLAAKIHEAVDRTCVKFKLQPATEFKRGDASSTCINIRKALVSGMFQQVSYIQCTKISYFWSGPHITTTNLYVQSISLLNFSSSSLACPLWVLMWSESGHESLLSILLKACTSLLNMRCHGVWTLSNYLYLYLYLYLLYCVSTGLQVVSLVSLRLRLQWDLNSLFEYLVRLAQFFIGLLF